MKPSTSGSGRADGPTGSPLDVSSLTRMKGEGYSSLQPKQIRQRLSIHAGPGELGTIPLPRGPQRGYLSIVTFVLLVIAPTVIGAVYYSAYASAQYVAEFKFTVKDNALPGGAGSSGLFAALGQSLSSTNTENYMVVDYLTSRQAVEDLEAKIQVRRFYTKGSIDWVSRFDASEPVEYFVSYWQKMVSTSYDPITGTASARIRAFSPADALLIAQSMVSLAEELVNQMGRRAQIDRVRFAERELERTQERVKNIRLQLMGERQKSEAAQNSTLLLDMERQIGQNLLAGAMQGLEQARAAASEQHLYITPYVRPSLPTSPTYPRKFIDPLIVATAAFALWLTMLLILRSIFERFS